MNLKPLSIRTCVLIILFFGIAAYSNTFNVPFQFDDTNDIINNQTLRPPLDLGRIWKTSPSRPVTNISFALQFAITGSASWGFHCVNLLIHLLAALAVFGITRLLLRTPVLREAIPSDQWTLFALGPALLFLTHPVQTEAVTYIVQRLASLATLFYLATLWMYLKARLEDSRHYRLVFFFMLAALFTKEICFTLPLAMLLIDFSFFPLSDAETISKKIRRWLPFAALALVTLSYLYISSAGKFVHNHGATDTQISRWDYLLTQFRVLRTYLRLLVFPINQCIDYDYRVTSGWKDPDTWAAFSLLLSIFILTLVFFKKNRLLSFGILWFFLTLSIESSFIPLKDVIFEHRLYLPMFSFSLFLSSLLWQCVRSSSRFMALILIIAVVLSCMTYARNEVWKSSFTLWQDAVRKSPKKSRPYAMLGEIYAKELRDYRTALFYFQKAVANRTGSAILLSEMADAYSALGDPGKSVYYREWALSFSKSNKNTPPQDLPLYQTALLKAQKNTPAAVNTLQKAIENDPQNPYLYIQLGEFYRDSGQEDNAIATFQKAIHIAPSFKGGYDALALLYKEKGAEQKALAVLVEYLKFKKKHKPLFGN